MIWTEEEWRDLFLRYASPYFSPLALRLLRLSFLSPPSACLRLDEGVYVNSLTAPCASNCDEKRLKG